VAVPPTGDVPAALARALASIDGRAGPVDRWTAERLPELVDRWYRTVVEADPTARAKRP
jgi:hypothetical protein